MAMKYYPVCLAVQDRLCVVVGGGEVGERKVEGLLECGARVVVVSRNLAPSLQRLKEEGRIVHVDLDYEASVLEGAFLVMGATDREDVNDRIARDARHTGVLANIADDPEKCDFILPALLRRGDLLIAVSTGGSSPALAKQLRDELNERVGGEYETLVRVMGRLREEILARERPSDENREIFRAILATDVADCIRERNWEGVRKIIRELAGIDLVWEE